MGSSPTRLTTHSHHFCGPAVAHPATGAKRCRESPVSASSEPGAAIVDDSQMLIARSRGERAERPRVSRQNTGHHSDLGRAGWRRSLAGGQRRFVVTPEMRSGLEGDGAATEFFRRKFLDELPRRGEIGDQCSKGSSWDSPYEQGLTDQRGTSHGQTRRRFGACHLDLDQRLRSHRPTL